MTLIYDKRTLMGAIDICRAVYVQPRFGCGEAWVAITKKEAREFCNRIGTNETPHDYELSSFGQLRNRVLYLG